LQLDELRFAVRSPVSRAEEDEHRAFRSQNRLACPALAVLIAEAEIGDRLADLRTELADVDRRARALRREGDARQDCREQNGTYPHLGLEGPPSGGPLHHLTHRAHRFLIRWKSVRSLFRDLLLIDPDGKLAAIPFDNLGFDSGRLLDLRCHTGSAWIVVSNLAVSDAYGLHISAPASSVLVVSAFRRTLEKRRVRLQADLASPANPATTCIPVRLKPDTTPGQ